MDLRLPFSVAVGVPGIPGRIRSLPRIALPKRPALGTLNFRVLLAPLQPLSWIGLALVFGVLAQGATQARALRDWELGHAPSPTLWEKALSSHGFRRVQDPDSLHRAVRSLPLNIDQHGGVWITESGLWVGILGSAGSPEIFSRDPKAKVRPDGWIPQGRGWQGFESTLRFLERLRPHSAETSVRSPKKPRAPRDTREIQY